MPGEFASTRVTKCGGLRVLRYLGDLIPERKCLRTDVSILLRRQAVSLAPEGVVDRAICR